MAQAATASRFHGLIADQTRNENLWSKNLLSNMSNTHYGTRLSVISTRLMCARIRDIGVQANAEPHSYGFAEALIAQTFHVHKLCIVSFGCFTLRLANILCWTY